MKTKLLSLSLLSILSFSSFADCGQIETFNHYLKKEITYDVCADVDESADSYLLTNLSQDILAGRDFLGGSIGRAAVANIICKSITGKTPSSTIVKVKQTDKTIIIVGEMQGHTRVAYKGQWAWLDKQPEVNQANTVETVRCFK